MQTRVRLNQGADDGGGVEYEFWRQREMRDGIES